METLTRLSFAFVVLTCVAAHALAQTPERTEPEWITVSPKSEGFVARMPKQPESVGQRVSAKGLNADGVRYAVAADERTTFIVWSMKGSNASGPLGAAGYTGPLFSGGVGYLDDADELAWELIITPEYNRIEREKRGLRRLLDATVHPGMAYEREFVLSGVPAREYRVWLEKLRGVVYVCAEGERVYVVAALGADEQDPRLKQFADSFSLKSATSKPVADGGSPGGGASVSLGPSYGGYGGGGGGGSVAVDYSRTFRPVEVTKKAVITSKPEPGFTKEASKFNVTGTVRIRGVLSATGKVEKLNVVKRLPHGLTDKALEAAKRIKFKPAQKDDRSVSQYIILDYYFNIY